MDINKILKEELKALVANLDSDKQLTLKEKIAAYGACIGFAFNVSQRVLARQSAEGHVHAVCKCHNGGAVVTTACKGGRHEHEFTPKPLQLTTPRLAKAIGQNVRTVSCYAYRHGLGVIDPKRRVRVFNQEDAEAVAKHFKVNTKKEK